MNTQIPDLGTAVVTADKHVAGRVSTIEGECFKVDKPMSPDEWLGLDVIDRIEEDVHLTMTREEIEGAPGPNPAHLGYHRHYDA